MVSGRNFAAVIAAVIVIGGIIMGVSGFASVNLGSFSSQPDLVSRGLTFGSSAGPSNGFQWLRSSSPSTSVVRVTTSLSTVGYPFLAASTGNGSSPGGSGAVSVGSGGSLQFSSSLTIVSLHPSQFAGQVVALAYGVGGYVAYQSTVTDSAYVVIRVPASSYQSVLSQIQGMGNVTSLTSNSNDVTVQYTDLNATLQSLLTEQRTLLRLANQSTSISNTLAIVSQLQSVDSQINGVRSQILQTKTLIQFSTITVTISKEAEHVPLSVSLSATPRSGVGPLSVTLNAVVKGGAPSYFINYNFGDGSSAEGQIVVHMFWEPADYNITVSVTDSNGTVAMSSALVHVLGSGRSEFTAFLGTVGGLFVRVVEGIVEVAAVVIPLGLVALVLLYPLQRRARARQLKPGP